MLEADSSAVCSNCQIEPREQSFASSHKHDTAKLQENKTAKFVFEVVTIHIQRSDITSKSIHVSRLHLNNLNDMCSLSDSEQLAVY